MFALAVRQPCWHKPRITWQWWRLQQNVSWPNITIESSQPVSDEDFVTRCLFWLCNLQSWRKTAAIHANYFWGSRGCSNSSESNATHSVPKLLLPCTAASNQKYNANHLVPEFLMLNPDASILSYAWLAAQCSRLLFFLCYYNQLLDNVNPGLIKPGPHWNFSSSILFFSFGFQSLSMQENLSLRCLYRACIPVDPAWRPRTQWRPSKLDHVRIF